MSQLKKALSRRSRQGGPGCLLLFALPFLVAGGLLTWFFLVVPGSRLLAAQGWQETPCVILTSGVEESSDSDGTTYRVAIAYTYTVSGVRYQSDRYDFLGAYSSGYQGKAKVVERYPPGAVTTCYVDPEDPSQAVLDRRFKAIYLFALLPLLFLGAGVGMGLAGLRGLRKAKAPAGEPRPHRVSRPIEDPFAAAAGPLVLEPSASPLAKLVGLTLVALFWNGIVSVFVFQAVEGWQGGSPDGCLIVFLIPFVLIGLLLLLASVRQFLVLFNPRLTLTLPHGQLAPGESSYLQWSIAGRASRVQRLRIVLEGREEATYRQGTNTRTDRSVFAQATVVEATEPYTIAAGGAALAIPADGVPSFKADHNKVIWTLKATCDIPGWPDSDDEYEIQVRPAAGPEGMRWTG